MSDWFTNTLEDAGRWEWRHAEPDDDRPTRADLADEDDEAGNPNACCPSSRVAAARFCGCGGAA